MGASGSPSRGLILRVWETGIAEAVKQAARALRAGELVVFPASGLYGLAADADQPQAVGRIFDAKGRPKDHPLIVHLAGASAAQWQAGVAHYARELPDFAALKPARREVDIEIAYQGFVIPNEFVVGYGLDYGENYRNLRFVGVLKESVYKTKRG